MSFSFDLIPLVSHHLSIFHYIIKDDYFVTVCEYLLTTLIFSQRIRNESAFLCMNKDDTLL